MIRYTLSGAACALCLTIVLSGAATAHEPAAASTQGAASAQMAQMQGHDMSMPMATPPAAGPSATATVGTVHITGAYARASLGTVPNSAAYMTLSTTGGPDRLIAVSTPVAKMAGLHTNIIDKNNVMRMRPVDSIAVKPGSKTQLRPGGLHVMLMGLKGPLKAGTTLPLTLTFEKAGKVTLQVPVRGFAAMRPGGHGGPMR